EDGVAEVRVAAEHPDQRGERDREGRGHGEQPRQGDPARELPAHAGAVAGQGPGEALARPPLGGLGDEFLQFLHVCIPVSWVAASTPPSSARGKLRTSRHCSPTCSKSSIEQTVNRPAKSRIDSWAWSRRSPVRLWAMVTCG